MRNDLPRWFLAASLLAAVVSSGCAQAPVVVTAQPAGIQEISSPPQVSSIVLHGPAAHEDLLDALQTFNDLPLDSELAASAAAYVRDYYNWLEWRKVKVFVDNITDANGALHIIVAGDPPEDLEAPPEANVEIAVAEPVDDVPVPAPREPGGARIESALDDSFRPWLQTASRVLIDAADKRLYLKQDGGRVISYAVAVGTARTPSPPGDYTVEAIRSKPTWYPPASIRAEYARKGKTLAAAIPPGAHNPLGDWFVKLQNGIGIHGTNQPRSIGRAASHGCIRMHDRDVNDLVKALRRGDGITIVRARPALTATRQ